ncbi:fumarylacetoacetate hydrolase family protein [Mariniflexile litorale]|uniref:Fumarylacetoacetate hydrolase family protein n=1 Tax=Mariniflexile litorale TaxID=3045158 RepID=A0AAU7EHB0_9FLAO|nr:fumarylacetoacetate hydrolase family protein [Mariniflexile sp. KMM 9835]MDQ8210842.1 fumarylacetoacetate hydrolase family protein [Mariniflexile sp. KMM 9835]
MKIYNTSKGVLIELEKMFHLINKNWDELINDDNLYNNLKSIVNTSAPIDNHHDLIDNYLKAPLESQEIWASGVTYFNSKMARQEESKDAGGADFYERVYYADRPELFFKATAHRSVPSGGKVTIRKDSTWDVPEPELTLVITSNGKIIGYTIGNDMSSRSIEGENPLYLPQAKTFDACAGVGPCVLVTDKPLPLDTKIHLKVIRNTDVIFDETTSISKMKRNPQELVEYLFRECTFPKGCLLMTGTGIVPTTDFTLKSKDEIQISIDHIGTLINYVR